MNLHWAKDIYEYAAIHDVWDLCVDRAKTIHHVYRVRGEPGVAASWLPSNERFKDMETARACGEAMFMLEQS